MSQILHATYLCKKFILWAKFIFIGFFCCISHLNLICDHHMSNTNEEWILYPKTGDSWVYVALELSTRKYPRHHNIKKVSESSMIREGQFGSWRCLSSWKYFIDIPSSETVSLSLKSMWGCKHVKIYLSALLVWMSSISKQNTYKNIYNSGGKSAWPNC